MLKNYFGNEYQTKNNTWVGYLTNLLLEASGPLMLYSEEKIKLSSLEREENALPLSNGHSQIKKIGKSCNWKKKTDWSVGYIISQKSKKTKVLDKNLKKTFWRKKKRIIHASLLEKKRSKERRRSSTWCEVFLFLTKALFSSWTNFFPRLLTKHSLGKNKTIEFLSLHSKFR